MTQTANPPAVRTSEPGPDVGAVLDRAVGYLRGIQHPEGYWKGELDVQGVKLRLALKIAKANDGTYSGTMDKIGRAHV